MANDLPVCGQRPRGADRKEDKKMAKKTVKRLKKSSKMQPTKTLHGGLGPNG